MFILATVAAGVLASFLAGMLNEGLKHYIGDLWDEDKEIKKLRESLDEQLKLLEFMKTLKNVHSGLPRDKLDELERYRYEIEDIQESMDLESKKKIVAKFLKIYIDCVRICIELPKEEHNMEAGHSSTQDDECLADELLNSRIEYKSNIIEELTTTTTNQFGVSVIGMGGIGKTILAKAIAGEARINSYFPCILSPPQSHSFNWQNVLGYINRTGLPSKDDRVLILLDGMHLVNPEDWHKFWSHCQKILNPESKVLIATQNPRVANVTGTSKYCLPPLLEEECFSLIHNLANAKGNVSQADDRAIRHCKKELVDTCRELPLLASQIGILLAAEEPGHRQSKITDLTTNSSWEVPDLERVLVNLKPVSLLAEEPNLRRCLAYCSLFPRDHEFKEDNLVQFWMAEGFTQRSRDASYLEETTRRYFVELLSCSLFQTSASPPGEKPSYKLHGLFYDLALNVASKTFCQKHIGKSISSPDISSNTRHFSLTCEKNKEFDMEPLLRNLQSLCRGLRTFLLVNESGKKIKKNPTFFQSLTRLRVLDLSHTNLTNLEPKRISELKYLRYLDLSHTPVVKLPKLSKSLELQVLKLIHCDNLRDLPKDLTKLTSLMSLEVNTRGLGSMPLGIGKLRNLQRLDLFIVGKKEGLKITELENLNDLRDSLRITQLENVKTEQEAQDAMLCKKEKLERLELEWSSSAPNDAAEQVLQGLEPPKNLKELMIKNYCGAEFPEWLSRTKLLESIQVEKCQRLLTLPPLDCLESLEKLEISWCTQLKELPTLPASLNSLIINHSDILKQRCQVGEADWPKIRGIQVVIDSNPVDTSQPDPATAGHQSSTVQGTPNGDQQTSSHLQCTTSLLPIGRQPA